MSFLKYLNLSDNGMAFDPRTGESYQLNESGRTILTLLQADESVEKIAKQISKQFSVSYGKALTDIFEFQTQLKIIGLLE